MERRLRTPATAAGALLVVLTLTACGSTVVPQTYSDVSMGSAGGLSDPVSGELGGPPGAASTEVVDAPTGTAPAEQLRRTGPGTAGASAPRDALAPGAGTSAAGGRPAGPVGPGVTDAAVNVGIVYTSQANNVGEQFGAKNLVYGDLLAQQRAVADHINRTGGVAGGRKINLVAYDAASDASPQAVCAGWNEDNKVFAGIYPGGQVASDTMAQCMANNRAIYISSPFIPGDQAFFDKFGPYYYTPNALETVTMGREYVKGLESIGYFDGDARVGLIYYDVPSLRSALEQGVKPALAALGRELDEEAAVAYPQDSSEYGDSFAALNSAILKFKAEGINRVMFLDTGSALCFFFLQQARTQDYRPKLGLMSGSHPSFIAENFDAETLRGTVGVGWLPAVDVDAAGVPDNDARKLCRRIMAAAGQAAQAQTDQSVQYHMCSAFFFLRDALRLASAPNAAALQAGLAQASPLASASAGSLGEGYSPRKHWGATAYSTHAYSDRCGCFRYTGSPRRLG